MLNLSEGGALVAGGERDVGEILSFELSRPRVFRFAGLAEVAHSTKGATGLRFLDADASGVRQIEDLIATRMRGKLLGSSASAILGLYLVIGWLLRAGGRGHRVVSGGDADRARPAGYGGPAGDHGCLKRPAV